MKLVSSEQAAKWSKKSEKIYVPFDTSYSYHPEYDEFHLGTEFCNCLHSLVMRFSLTYILKRRQIRNCPTSKFDQVTRILHYCNTLIRVIPYVNYFKNIKIIHHEL